jgi:soluble lytic murein transglycosylase-like protein
MAKLIEGARQAGRRAASRACAAVLAALLAVPVPAGAHIYVYTDPAGEVMLTDAPRPAHWHMLFMLEEPGSLTAPRATVARGGCAGGARIAPAWEADVPVIAGEIGLDPHLIHAVIWAESNCNPAALSPKGARGLMQLMPSTARQYGVTDAFNPHQNIRGGARYLRDLLDLFGGNVELALAAYNAGPKSVLDARMRIPPFRETMAYVPVVLKRLAILRAR